MLYTEGGLGQCYTQRGAGPGQCYTEGGPVQCYTQRGAQYSVIHRGGPSALLYTEGGPEYTTHYFRTTGQFRTAGRILLSCRTTSVSPSTSPVTLDLSWSREATVVLVTSKEYWSDGMVTTSE